MKNHFEKGFTLVEIMVVIAIFALLAAIVLETNFSSRKRINALSLDADSLALEIRDMQNRTLSFIDSASVPADTKGYGIYIDLTDSVKVKSFYKNSNPAFCGSSSGCTSSDIPALDTPNSLVLFQLGDRISKVCLNGHCSAPGGSNLASSLNFNKLAIFFVKPEQYANFYISTDNGSSFKNTFGYSIPDIAINQVCIEMNTGQNEYRHIDVFYVGQISVSPGACVN